MSDHDYKRAIAETNRMDEAAQSKDSIMRDYISLAAELVRKAPQDECECDHGDLMREAAVMLRKQGDQLKRLNTVSKPEPEENPKDFKW